MAKGSSNEARSRLNREVLSRAFQAGREGRYQVVVVDVAFTELVLP